MARKLFKVKKGVVKGMWACYFWPASTYPGNFALHLGEVLLLRPGEQLLPAGDGQDDGISHAVVMQAQIHCTFKVACQQSLCDQPIHICNDTGVHFQMLPQKPLRDAAAGDTVWLYKAGTGLCKPACSQPGITGCSPSPPASNTHGAQPCRRALSSITYLVTEQVPRGLSGP